MQLLRFRTRVAKVSRASAGQALGVTGITVWRWETGRSIPTPPALKAIDSWSGGKVKPNDFIKVDA